METIEIYAFVCKGIAGAPPDTHGVHITGDPQDSPKTKPLPDRTMRGLGRAGFSYWALSVNGAQELPRGLIHVYFEGVLPGDKQRDSINAAIVQLTRRALAS